MFEVLITACLAAAPAQCSTFELRLKLYDDIGQCARHAQSDVVRWADHKPQWRIARWACTAPGETI
ncbi:hypothetical protein C8N35_10122 [Breoghania corrubedonensis]|uniref:Uncharacterized protein n=1 Tax=Breoghania corrubedonensis TaxID=665038 RepID=A0A2T5VE06_9HYPH|nr:hypothetical protein [Breoghania corrubedonensis]PTW61990.1 hypothetical protein C8N35_10122 [Breoghania corrubedonensis]